MPANPFGWIFRNFLLALNDLIEQNRNFFLSNDELNKDIDQ